MKKHLLFWLTLLTTFFGLLILFHHVLLPFGAGIVLAFLLDPLVTRLTTRGIGRLLATSLVMSFFIFLFALILFLVVPPLTAQLSQFLTKLPSYAQNLQTLVKAQNTEWLKSLLGENMPDISSSFGDMLSKTIGFIGQFLTNIVSGGAAVVSVVSLLFVTPVIAFYLLLDWPSLLKKIESWVPPKAQLDVRHIAIEMNTALTGFLRGQSLVCLLLGCIYALGLWAIGLNFGFIIGMMTGILSFIPYVGATIGLVLAVGVAIVQFYPAMTPLVLVLILFGVGQFFESNILSPKLVGESVGLHPVWLLFSLFAFGSLFGFMGLLLAVPLAAMFGVLIRYGLRRYLKSDFYQ